LEAIIRGSSESYATLFGAIILLFWKDFLEKEEEADIEEVGNGFNHSRTEPEACRTMRQRSGRKEL
jgi:hypothetical protein